MAQNEQDNSKEIDLTRISQHIRRYFSRVNDSIFEGILFIKRFIIIIVLLVVAGGVWGYFKDKSAHAYNHKILVTPNFKSTDYLYEEVERLNGKIRERDSVYLKQLGFKKIKELSAIKIEPVVDVYGFLNEKANGFDVQSDKKFELFRILTEKGDLKKVLEDPTTSKNYDHHLITFVTSKESAAQDVAEPLMNYLNSNPYYKNVQQEYTKSLDARLALNDSTIKQIDVILNNYTGSSRKSAGNLMYYNDNTELSEVIKAKTVLLDEQEQNKVRKVNYTKIVKDNTILLNIKNVTATTGRMKIIIPLVFLLIFVIVMRFIKFYKYQAAKRRAV